MSDCCVWFVDLLLVMFLFGIKKVVKKFVCMNFMVVEDEESLEVFEDVIDDGLLIKIFLLLVVYVCICMLCF